MATERVLFASVHARRRRRSAPFALALALVAPGAAAGSDWIEPFSQDPEELLAEAAALEVSGADVVVLREYRRLTFAADGALTDDYYRVYRIVTADGAEGWDETESSWSPWYEDRPEIRTRVITANGTVHDLDPTTISEQPVEAAPDVFTDQRALAVPLPAVTVGSVVEERIVTRERIPPYAGGWIHAYMLLDFARVEDRRFVLEYPEDLPIRHELVHYDLAEVKRDEDDGRVRITFELPHPEPTDFEDLFRVDAKFPILAISTGESWEAAALVYHALVEEKLQGFEPDLDVVGTARALQDPRAAAIELTRWMYEMVRYTGLELGDSGLVPAAPADVLGRRYGDCKDQAVLLTGLLRAAGYEADLVILDTDENDLPEGLVGFGQFDHAIVRVTADPPIWIDPTAPQAPVGTLPTSDQGRRALVIARETKELSETPLSTSADNRSVETREVFLPEMGRGRIVETTEASGQIELLYRIDFAEMAEEEIRESGEEYVIDQYVAKELGAAEHSQLEDPYDPFLLRFEALEAGVAVTDESFAAARINPFVLFSRCPSELWEEAEQDDEADEPDDVVMMWPYSFALRYRIHPPDGFEPRELPDAESFRFGPIVLAWDFRENEQGMIEADLDFDTGGRRITAEQAAELRGVVEPVYANGGFLIEFEHVGHSLLAAGQVVEAIEEFRALASRHPESAVHRARLANALVEVGLGDAARTHAKRAVKLDGESVFAYRSLGHVLKHDSVGRPLARGFDRAGALEAYERAHELDPESTAAWASLAELLQYDETGRRKRTDEGLAPALEAYLELRRTLEDASWDSQILDLYLRMGRTEELLEFIDGLDLTVELAAHRLAVTAANKGTKVALRGVSAFDTAYRAPILGQSGLCLLKMRRYPEAAAMLKAGSVASGASETLGFAGIVQNVRPWEDIEADAQGPSSVVVQVIGQQLSAGLFTGRTEDFSKRWRDLEDELGMDIEATTLAANQEVEHMVETLGVSTETMADLVLSLLEFKPEGDDESGYRVSFLGPAEVEIDGHTYVLLEKGQYRLFPAEDSEAESSLLALLALEHLEAGRLDAAARWLDWAREIHESGPTGDPYAVSSLLRFWGPDVEPTEANARIAIAFALAESPATASRGRKNLEGVEDLEVNRRPSLDLALASVCVFRGDDEDALVHATRAYEAVPDSPAIMTAVASILDRVGERERSRSVAREFLERHPEESAVLGLLADLTFREGALIEAQERYREILEIDRQNAAACNQLAWISLFLEDTSEEDVRLAHRAVEGTGRELGRLHTLACVYAELGQVMEAKQIAHEAMRGQTGDEPDPMYWAVFGRIADRLGEREAAEAAYRRAGKAEDGAPFSSSALARRWLEQLQQRKS